ncbi:amidohydrolase family protein [Methanonatronarchaeum sp. AMET-Sl]|uniref:amidohydrolase family protein n=1 Tax=Methanonatronarchaeum sp. AMET-Sl TaxID=3037654 RepID=UPI00244DB6C2|nr:amidohydrolase family protein [Methanonatronarchaeum sp. AMET-Sl]WGI16868.1 amidohydrolase family protein [Methanonatronarchaeum sp. AMET-Sl]
MIDGFGKIDAHSHLGYYGGFFDVEIGVGELVGLMDEFGFDRSVVCSLDNEEVLKAVRRYPSRLVGKVWLDPKEQGVVDKAWRYVDEFGFRAIKIHPLLHSFPANSDLVDPVARVACQLDVPLFVHSGHPPFSLPNQIAGLAKKHRDTNVVLVHMGHGHGVYIENAIQAASEHPNLFLETSGMPMHTKIKEAFERVDSHKILFGTDIPFHHPSVELEKVKVADLTSQQKKKLLQKNAKKLLTL